MLGSMTDPVKRGGAEKPVEKPAVASPGGLHGGGSIHSMIGWHAPETDTQMAGNGKGGWGAGEGLHPVVYPISSVRNIAFLEF